MSKKNWKTKVAAALLGVGAVVGMGIYFLAGPDATLAVPPSEGIAIALGAFGLNGARDAIQKAIDAVGSK